MKKIIAGVMIVSSMLFGGIVHEEKNYSYLDKIPKKELAQELTKELVKNLNLPLKLDKITVLQNIFAYDDDILLLKTLDDDNYKIKEIMNNKKIKQIFIKKMLIADSQHFCNDSIWSYLINKRNIIPEINYYNRKGKLLFKYTIEPSDCEKVKH